jgi:acetyltransferase-like isoleucine patch superfamily enzyme
MFIKEIIRKSKYCYSADRIGPDLPFTHWKLHFKTSMMSLCKKKFKKFSNSAEVRPGAFIVGCSNIEIGDRVVLRPGTMLFGELGEGEIGKSYIIIEDDVMIGSGVHLYTNNHRFDLMDIPIIDQGYYDSKQVVLKKGCWIGANAIILPGVTIGENSVVGAGSVVTKSIPDRVVAVGSPARIIKVIGAE